MDKAEKISNINVQNPPKVGYTINNQNDHTLSLGLTPINYNTDNNPDYLNDESLTPPWAKKYSPLYASTGADVINSSELKINSVANEESLVKTIFKETAAYLSEKYETICGNVKEFANKFKEKYEETKAFILEKIKGLEELFDKQDKERKRSFEPDAATEAFMYGYEGTMRPQHLEDRKAYAQAAYEKFAGKY